MTVPREAHAAGQRCGEVVRVPLERDAELEEAFRVEGVAVGRGRRGEAERDDRRARAEPSLARDLTVKSNASPLGSASSEYACTPRWSRSGSPPSLTAARSRGRAPPPHSRSPARCSRSTPARARERKRQRHALHDSDLVGVDFDRRRGDALHGVGILEPVPGDDDDDGAGRSHLHDRGEPRGARRLAEHTFTFGELLPRDDDLVIRERTTAPPESRMAASACTRWAGSTMRIAEARVSFRSAAAPARKRGMPAPHSPNPRDRHACCRRRRRAARARPARCRAPPRSRTLRSSVPRSVGVERVHEHELPASPSACAARSDWSNVPRTWTSRAPTARACASLPSATAPCGQQDLRRQAGARRVRRRRRGRVPGRRADHPVAPAATARDTATVIPRSLNDPVGFMLSSFSQRSTPSSSESTSACMSGVEPS